MTNDPDLTESVFQLQVWDTKRGWVICFVYSQMISFSREQDKQRVILASEWYTKALEYRYNMSCAKNSEVGHRQCMP